MNLAIQKAPTLQKNYKAMITIQLIKQNPEREGLPTYWLHCVCTFSATWFQIASNPEVVKNSTTNSPAECKFVIVKTTDPGVYVHHPISVLVNLGVVSPFLADGNDFKVTFSEPNGEVLYDSLLLPGSVTTQIEANELSRPWKLFN